MSQTFFELTKVCREDFEDVGYDAAILSDEDMERVTDRMNEALQESLYWEVLRTMAREFKLPQLPKKAKGE